MPPRSILEGWLGANICESVRAEQRKRIDFFGEIAGFHAGNSADQKSAL